MIRYRVQSIFDGFSSLLHDFSYMTYFSMDEKIFGTQNIFKMDYYEQIMIILKKKALYDKITKQNSYTFTCMIYYKAKICLYVTLHTVKNL